MSWRHVFEEDRNEILSATMMLIQSGPVERPMRTDYNCKRSLVGEEREGPTGFPRGLPPLAYPATTCQRTSGDGIPAYTGVYRGTQRTTSRLPPNLLQNRFHLLSRAPNTPNAPECARPIIGESKFLFFLGRGPKTRLG